MFTAGWIMGDKPGDDDDAPLQIADHLMQTSDVEVADPDECYEELDMDSLLLQADE